ncbi:unnamed protein product [Lampetra fluviatilis]
MAAVRVALPAGEMVWVCRRVDTEPTLDHKAVDAFLVELYRCRRCFFTSCVTATMLDHLHQNHSDGLATTPQPAPASPAAAPSQSPSSPTSRVLSSADPEPCGDTDAASAAERFSSGMDECGGSSADTATDGTLAIGSCPVREDAPQSPQRHAAIEHGEEDASLKASSGLSVAREAPPCGSHSELGDDLDREECRLTLTKGESAGSSNLQAECRGKHQTGAALENEQAGSGMESAVCGPENLDRISREVDRMLRCLSPASCEMIGLVGGCHDDADDAGFFEAMMEAARPLPRSRDEAEETDEADEAQSEHLFSLGLCRTSAMARRPLGGEPGVKVRCAPPNVACEGAGLTVKTSDVCVEPGGQGPIPEVEKKNVFFALDAVGGNTTAAEHEEAEDGEEACYSSLVVDLSASASAKRKRATRRTSSPKDCPPASHPRRSVKKSCAKSAANKKKKLERKPVKLGLTRVSQRRAHTSQPAVSSCSEAATFMDPCFLKDHTDWVVRNVHQQLDRKLPEQTLNGATVCIPRRQQQQHNRRCGGAKSGKRFRCSECPRMFVSEPLRDVHLVCHCPQGFQCCYCDFTGRKWKRMRKHLVTHDLVSLVWSSDSPRVPPLATRGHPPHGGASLGAPSARARVQSRPPESGEDSRVSTKPHSDRTFRCTACGRECSTRQALYRHVKTHTNEKPYICSQCGHQTRLKASLDMHMRTHTGEKPFQCELCPYSSSDASCLRRHKRTHASEKPHNCTLCSYTCIQKKCMDTHMRRTHTGESLSCPRCPFSTYNRQSLGRHLARHRSSAKQLPRSELAPHVQSTRRVGRGGRARTRGGHTGHDQPQDFEKVEVQVVAEWLTGTI